MGRPRKAFVHVNPKDVSLVEDTLREGLLKAKQEAWDEGYLAGTNYRSTDRSTWSNNPYRKWKKGR